MTEQIDRLEAKIAALDKEIQRGASERKESEIKAEVQRQAPSAPGYLGNMAVLEMATTTHSGDVVAGVSSFLRSDAAQYILKASSPSSAQPAPPATAPATPQQRPKLSKMLGDIKSGKAKLRL